MISIMAFGLLCVQSENEAFAKQTKVALVIGNADYPQKTGNDVLIPLSNPVNNAEDIKTLLEERYHFQVLLLTNANCEQMDDAISQFRDELRDNQSDVGLLYYSGHGIESGGINYLTPIPTSDHAGCDDIGGMWGINANEILENITKINPNMPIQPPIGILILDACRTDVTTPNDLLLLEEKIKKTQMALKPQPELPNMERSGMGLAEMQMGGAFIGYAAAPGQPAYGNSSHRNSFYTKALLKYSIIRLH